MRYIVRIVPTLVLALLLNACQAPPKAQTVTPTEQETPAAQTPEKPAETPPPAAQPPAHTPPPAARPKSTIDDLIPRMADDDVDVRAAARREFEMLCNAAAAPGHEEERVALCNRITERLGEQTPLPARIWMIRQLERIGGAESLMALGLLLRDSNFQVRETARRALQLNPAAEVRDVIEAALAETRDDAWRIALINVLAARREEASVLVLTQYVSHANADVAAAAVAALADVGGSKARAALYRTWLNDKSPVKRNAEAGLLRTTETLITEGNTRAAARLYQDVYERCDTDAAYFAALNGMTRAQGLGALVSLIDHMKMDDPETALRAARLALEIPDEATALTLGLMMSKLPPHIQAVLIEGFGDFGDNTARSAVIKGVRGTEPEIRQAALRALRKIGNSSDLPLLIQIAARPDDPAREEARRTLALLPDKNAGEALVNLYATRTDAGERIEIIRACAARRYAGAIDTLLATLGKDDTDLQIAAYEALAELLPPEQLSKIGARLAGELAPTVREAAENAAVATALRDPQADDRCNALIAGLPHSKGEAKASLVRVLGRLGGRKAWEAVHSQYPNEDPVVADAVVRALSDWPDALALHDLLKLAQHSSEDAHRVLALRGYVRLVRLPSQRKPQETYKMLEPALSCATRAEEKKLVLSALAEVRSVDALMLVEPSLNDAELRDEAALAMLKIAKSLCAEQPEAALAAVAKVRAMPTGAAVTRQADEAAEFVNHFAGYGTCWLISGSYRQERKDAAELFDIAFAPEEEGQAVEFKALAPTDDAQPWIYDLAKAVGGGNCCVYVKTRVWSEQGGPARLEIGSDDGVKAWLNGQLVHANMKIRPVQPAEDKANVELKPGWNTLMLKIVQGGGGWGFTAGFTAPDGARLPGLRYEAN